MDISQYGTNSPSRTSLRVLCALIPLALTGCMAVPLAMIGADGIGMVNGSMGNSVAVTINEKTFTQSVRTTLATAQHWAVVSEDSSDAKGWEIMEERGGYQISLERLSAGTKTGGLLASERRTLLTKMCTAHKSEVAMLGVSGVESNGNMLKTAFTGRAQIVGSGTVYGLKCATKVAFTFGYSFQANMGLYNGNEGQMNAAMAKEFANQMLLALSNPSVKPKGG